MSERARGDSTPLIEAARRGEEWAAQEISRLIRRCARLVCARGRSLTSLGIEWEDVAQEASLRFYGAGIRQFRGGGSVEGYIYKIVKSTFIQLIRQVTRRREREKTGAVRDGESNPGLPQLVAIWPVMKRLDAACRELIEKVFLRGATYAELATETGLAESSVRARLSRCIRRAREIAAG